MFRSILLLLSGNAAASLLLLARNLLVARLISVENYGIAATFAISMAIVEMMSALGLQQQIVQSKDGENLRFQAALQGFQVLRGAFAAGILFFSAGAIARFLGIPEVAWAYQVMALVPLLNALQHFDIHRLNRQMRFWPVVLTGAVPALISLLAIWPLYQIFDDYRVMLWAIVLQMSLMLVVSHMVAERPYRLVLDRKIMAGALRFGWPLLFDGMLLFIVFNGDKLIVGRLLGMEALALFAMGVTLSLTPTLVLTKSGLNFFLPQLSARDAQSDSFKDIARLAITASTLFSLGTILMLAIFGPYFISVVLNAEYEPLAKILVGIAAIFAMRTLRTACATISIAVGHTIDSMSPNLTKVVALPLIWYVVVQTGDLNLLILISVLAELVSLGVAIALVQYRTQLVTRQPVPFVVSGLGAVLVLLIGMGQIFPVPYISLIGWIGCGSLCAILTFWGGKDVKALNLGAVKDPA